MTNETNETGHEPFTDSNGTEYIRDAGNGMIHRVGPKQAKGTRAFPPPPTAPEEIIEVP